MSARRPTVRPPAVAGTFYPADPDELGALVRRRARGRHRATGRAGARPAPKAIVAPHAGYIYSGPGRRHRLRPRRSASPRRSTAWCCSGPPTACRSTAMAVPRCRRLRHAARRRGRRRRGPRRARRSCRASCVDDRPHADEHSLEVHLPVPAARAGRRAARGARSSSARSRASEVADVLDALWGGPETLVVVSTDLSHYHDHATAQGLDAATAAAIVGPRWSRRGAGADAAARSRCAGCSSSRPSGRASPSSCSTSAPRATPAGDRDRVVGYGCVRGRMTPMVDHDALLSPADRRWLLRLARRPSAHGLDDGGAPPARSRGGARRGAPAPGAAFVTLRRDGRLLGCIGSMEPRRARSPTTSPPTPTTPPSAIPGCPPVTLDDWEHMDVEVSVLGPLEALDVRRPGRAARGRCARASTGCCSPAARVAGTFLPSVWEQVRSARRVPRPALAQGRPAAPAGGPTTWWSSATRSSSSASTTSPPPTDVPSSRTGTSDARPGVHLPLRFAGERSGQERRRAR